MSETEKSIEISKYGSNSNLSSEQLKEMAQKVKKKIFLEKIKTK